MEPQIVPKQRSASEADNDAGVLWTRSHTRPHPRLSAELQRVRYAVDTVIDRTRRYTVMLLQAINNKNRYLAV